MKGQRPKPTPSCQLPPVSACCSFSAPWWWISHIRVTSCWATAAAVPRPALSRIQGSVGSLTGDSLFHDLSPAQRNLCLYLKSCAQTFLQSFKMERSLRKLVSAVSQKLIRGFPFRTVVFTYIWKFLCVFSSVVYEPIYVGHYIYASIRTSVLSVLSSIWSLYS